MTPQEKREPQNGRVTFPQDGALHRRPCVGRKKGSGGETPPSSTFPLEQKTRKSYKGFLVVYGNSQPVWHQSCHSLLLLDSTGVGAAALDPCSKVEGIKWTLEYWYMVAWPQTDWLWLGHCTINRCCKIHSAAIIDCEMQLLGSYICH